MLALKTMPVVVLTGARQSGKSTLAREIAPERTYLSLDDLDVLEQAKRDPDTLLQRAPVTLDEVPRAPEVLLAIKRKVDAARVPGAYLLTGSAQLALMHGVADTLAGRAVYIELPPFCPLEWHGSSKGPSLIDGLFEADVPLDAWAGRAAEGGDWVRWMLRGGYAPALSLDSPAALGIWFGGYVQTYLERDLRALTAVEGLPDFQRMMRVAAQRTGRLLNASEVARDAGLAQATCHRYLNLLETGFQIVKLPSYASNPTKALVKSPRLFWGDTGVAAWLAGIDSPETLRRRTDMGFWLEQTVFQTLQAWRAVDSVRRRLTYWRTRGGDEVDFVLESDDRCVAVEVKAGGRVGPGDTRGIRRFIEFQGHAGRQTRGVILYGGPDVRPLSGQIFALPHAALFPAAGPRQREGMKPADRA